MKQLTFISIKRVFSQLKYDKLNFQNPLTVSIILQKQKKDQAFVFRQTKKVCETLKDIFLQLPQNQKWALNELARFTQEINLSRFRSWRSLNNISVSIEQILNQKIAFRKQRLSKQNLIKYCRLLYGFNYNLQVTQDQQFCQSQIINNFDFNNLNLNSELDLKLLDAISKHHDVFVKLFSKKQNLEARLIKLTAQFQNASAQPKHEFFVNVIRNGIYINYWSLEFLQSIKKYLEILPCLSQPYQKLLNTIIINQKVQKSYQKDLWQTDTSKYFKKQKLVTQASITSLFQQMGYNVHPNSYLFGYEFDYKIGSRYIVEYHGPRHYWINTQYPIETKRSKWKIQTMQQRGYKVLIIHFYQWNKIDTIYHKKAWLINTFEKELFEF